MYKIKNLVEFYDRMQKSEKYKYGNNLEFIHNKEMFTEKDQKLLEFILKNAEIINTVNSNSNSNYRYYGKALDESSIVINKTILDELFEILKDRTILMQTENEDIIISFSENDPDLHFKIKKINDKEYKLLLNDNIDIIKDIKIFSGKEHTYILCRNIFYKCSKQFENTVIK